jgi:nanoRNase/pAp phosphatase (c-di-AMP/oligoRNAs hydrolase)
MAAATGGGGGAKAAVAEQIGQAVQSTSNLLQLMEQSSPAQVLFPALSLSIDN